MIQKNSVKQKILLALIAGTALSFSRSPKNSFKVLESFSKNWKDVDRQRLYRAVREFHKERLVSYKEDNGGNIKIILTKEGKKRALRYRLNEIKIKKPAKWDGFWRMVIFDIPEKNKKAREALRNNLKGLGFKELQKSVFIHPFECENEIDFVVEVFQIRSHVRFIRVDSFTNEEEMKIKFRL